MNPDEIVPLDAEAWNKRWIGGQTGWDIGEVSPPLVWAYKQGFVLPPDAGEVLVPGCGSGYEARFLAGKGYRVVGADLAPQAIAKARDLDPSGQVEWVVTDVLDEGAFEPDRFAWIYDQTFFCAIHPDLRQRYAQTLSRLVHTEVLTLNFRVDNREPHPPFDCSVEEYVQLLDEEGFRLKRQQFMADQSTPKRAGRETLLWLRTGS